MPVLFPILRMKTVNCLSVYFVFINCITSKRGVLIRAAHNNAPVYGRGTQNNSVAKHSLILEDAATSETVENWLREYDTEALTVFRNVAEAEWSYLTDMTESNKDNLIQARLQKAVFQRTSARKSLQYLNDSNLSDTTTQRQLDKITNIDISATDQREKFVRNVALELEEEKLYSRSKVKVNYQWMDTIPDAYAKFSSTEDVDVKKIIWVNIQNSFTDLKTLFAERVELTNEALQNLGYQNMADYWDSLYTGFFLSDTADKLWEQIRPLYELLHTYVRYRLREFYGDDTLFPSTRHIPEQVVGTPGSSDWLGVYDKVKPYNDVADINITNHIRQKMKDVKGMAIKVDEIFDTLGRNISDVELWNISRLSKPKFTNASCVPKAVNLYDKHARLQLCGAVDQTTFLSLFELLGEAYLISSYSRQPLPFQSEPFPGFGAAIGGLLSLSALTPTNLKRFDLTESLSEGYKSDVNYLFWMALRILPRLAHDYAVGRWKMATYSRWVNETTFNTQWWQLRCRYEGIVPPEPRSDFSFDAGSYTDAWKLEPFYRVFLSTLLQFQLHDSLCFYTGYTGTLNKCSLLDKEYVHQKLRSMLSLGSSHPWKTVTGDDELRAQPLLSYFSPLRLWLQGELSHIDDLKPTNLETMSKSCSWEISGGVSSKQSLILYHASNYLLLSLSYVLFIY